ncbi:MAG: hypothetical protein EOP82_07415 [Variovorax sp.]|nr:MAG: hypothetical protein EOP82_07415 [Variovorax sp.]
MMTASELVASRIAHRASRIAGVVILSCAGLQSPGPHRNRALSGQAWRSRAALDGERDSNPSLDDARKEFRTFPVADETLSIVPASSAHGDQLLSDPAAATVAKPALLAFLARVLPP